MARRVAEELNTPCGRDGEVGYQIRYDSHTVGKNCKVKFMTDGILLKEVRVCGRVEDRSNLTSYFVSIPS